MKNLTMEHEKANDLMSPKIKQSASIFDVYS